MLWWCSCRRVPSVPSWMLQELGAAWAMEKPIIPVTTGGGILNRMRVQLKATPALELGDIGNPEEADQFVGAGERYDT